MKENLLAKFEDHVLKFKKPVRTSRGVLRERTVSYLTLQDELGNTVFGEAAALKGISYEKKKFSDAEYLKKKDWIVENINLPSEEMDLALMEYPSLRFAYESAMLALKTDISKGMFPSDFTRNLDFLEINGLLWSSSLGKMRDHAQQLIDEGFHTLKMKVGVSAEKEEFLFSWLQKHHPGITLRLDANGAFLNYPMAIKNLHALQHFDIHSIEQPLAVATTADELKELKHLIADSPIPVALDEQLANGYFSDTKKADVLEYLKPKYLVLKPSMLGGFEETFSWIKSAHERGIAWWITSALESNHGLSIISQWTYIMMRHNKFKETALSVQGLGTGDLFERKYNFETPLYREQAKLFFCI